jgi:hypothetical protein
MNQFAMRLRIEPKPDSLHAAMIPGAFAIVLITAPSLEFGMVAAAAYLDREGWRVVEPLETGEADMERLTADPAYHSMLEMYARHGLACEIAAAAFDTDPGPAH